MISRASLNGKSILSYVSGLCNGVLKFEFPTLIWEKIDDVKSENGNRRTNTQSVFKSKRKDTELIKQTSLRINKNDDANYKPQDQRKDNLQRALFSFSLKFILSFATITLITTASCHDINVTWVMKSNLTFFGKTAELECVISDSVNFCNRTLRQWYGGNPYVFLCRNGVCRNQEKYEEQQEAMCKYTLKIYNFSEKDVNCDYTCAYGIYSSRKMLKLDNEHFTYLPMVNDISLNYTLDNEDMLNMTVSIQKSFPKPSCHASFAGNRILTTSAITSYGYFYKTEIRIVYTLPDCNCQGLFEVGCEIGSSQLEIVSYNITPGFTGQTNRHELSNHVILGTIFVVVIVFITVTVFVIMKKIQSSLYRRSKQPCQSLSLYAVRYTNARTTDTDDQLVV